MYDLRKTFSLLLIILIAGQASAQTKADKAVIRQLKKDIGYLASDALEGRATGSEGERKAGDFIIKEYQKAGIQPYMGQYRHPFTFVAGREIAGNAQITLGGRALKMGKDAFPLPFTGFQQVAGEVLPDIMEQNSIWLLPLYQNETEATDAHFDWEKYAYEKTKEAMKLGATGVLFYDGYNAKYPPAFNRQSDYDKLDIPAAVLLYDAWNELVQGAQAGGGIPVEMKLAVNKTEGKGQNIAAFIDNGARYTVVLGAHYDHLGYGDDAHSLHRGEKQIHNGADDNASGTAALLQLAARIRKDRLKNYNYVFIHFSGEELGLLGSKAIVKELGLDSTKVAYMLNMDMVGRLNDSTHALTVGGVGTSPIWGSVVRKDEYFRIAIDSSGVGPSDHTSFYHAGVPVLFFFTGTHRDYHKPSDDADKINYEGTARVISYIYNIVKNMDAQPKPVFTPTRQTATGKVRFRVTLGITPDYAYQEEGVRVDGVTDGKPAAVAGIQAGDIVIRLGEHKITGMQSYMEALGSFKAGDKTEVVILRGAEQKTLPIEFR